MLFKRQKLSYFALLLLLILSLGGTACGRLEASEQITPSDLMVAIDAQQAPVILDVRTPEEYAMGHIPGAVNIHFREIVNRLDEIEALGHSTIVVYCERGIRAQVAENTLVEAGYSVLHLDGDMVAWRSLGLPVE